MRISIQRLLMAGAVLLLSACSTMTSLSSTRPGTVVSLRETVVSTPGKQNLKSTSFTNYEFKAVDPDNEQPFYGLLPFAFRGGHLAADIILFAPGMFLNLRTPFPFYEFDVANRTLRYKFDESDAWTEYRPEPAEVARAEAYFGSASSTGGAAATAAKP